MNELLERTDEELLAMIGESLPSETMGALPPSIDRLCEIAREWIDKNTERIQSSLCKSKIIYKLAHDGNVSDLFLAVSVLIESLTLHSAASPLAAWICKRGVSTFCSITWRSTFAETDSKTIEE